MTATVWIIEAESVMTPGRIVSVHASKAGADAEAARLVNILREELDLLPDATSDDWAARLEKVTAVTEGAAYVEVTQREVQT